MERDTGLCPREVIARTRSLKQVPLVDHKGRIQVHLPELWQSFSHVMLEESCLHFAHYLHLWCQMMPNYHIVFAVYSCWMMIFFSERITGLVWGRQDTSAWLCVTGLFIFLKWYSDSCRDLLMLTCSSWVEKFAPELFLVNRFVQKHVAGQILVLHLLFLAAFQVLQHFPSVSHCYITPSAAPLVVAMVEALV